MNEELEKENKRLRKSLRFLISKVHDTTREIQVEVKTTGTSSAAKRIADLAILLESHAIIAQTVFKEKS